MRYVREVLAIADHFNKAMRKACPVSRWNEDISCGDQESSILRFLTRKVKNYICWLLMMVMS
uniref:Uncharacterized protein n=1 Tax=Oryza punctata TaxID=4537 RepID=A0A0E0M6L9_ORYPU